MIAMLRRHMVVFCAVVLTATVAWAQDAAQTTAPDGSALDAEVEVGVQAYDAGDYARAKAILLPLAEQGHPKAMNIVGRMHKKSDVFPNDPKLECDWYERSAKTGYVSAMYNLSICFNHGEGRPKDFEQMLRWRTMAAEKGFTLAMINLSTLDSSAGKEYRHWMVMAAEHGSRFALVDLWANGYKADAWSRGMTYRDIICVSWHVAFLDKDIDYCD